MDIERLIQEARQMGNGELRRALDWHESLAEHYDENMDFTGYEKSKTKADVVRAELTRRGYSAYERK